MKKKKKRSQSVGTAVSVVVYFLIEKQVLGVKLDLLPPQLYLEQVLESSLLLLLSPLPLPLLLPPPRGSGSQCCLSPTPSAATQLCALPGLSHQLS